MHDAPQSSSLLNLLLLLSHRQLSVIITFLLSNSIQDSYVPHTRILESCLLYLPSLSCAWRWPVLQLSRNVCEVRENTDTHFDEAKSRLITRAHFLKSSHISRSTPSSPAGCSCMKYHPRSMCTSYISRKNSRFFHLACLRYNIERCPSCCSHDESRLGLPSSLPNSLTLFLRAEVSSFTSALTR